jgi:hypothetical protein
MEFTVELRYQSGSSTVLTTHAETAEEALDHARDPRRALVGIHITGPAATDPPVPEHVPRSVTFRAGRPLAHHRPSRRHP